MAAHSVDPCHAIRNYDDDAIKWKHFPRYWPFVRVIHRWRVKSPTKAKDAELWYFLLSTPWINGWVNTRQVGDLRRHRGHHDVIVMIIANMQNITGYILLWFIHLDSNSYQLYHRISQFKISKLPMKLSPGLSANHWLKCQNCYL